MFLMSIEIIFIYIAIIVVVCFAKYEFNKIRKRYKINKKRLKKIRKNSKELKN